MVTVELGEVFKDSGDTRVVGTERLLVDRERTLHERFGLCEATLGVIQQGEVVEVSTDIRVFDPRALSAIASARFMSGSTSP